MATTRPYLLSPVKSNLLLRSIPLLLRFQNSVSSHASLISISKNRASNFPRSCNIDTPISNETRVFHESRFRLVRQREFVTRATNVSDAGSIDTPLIQSMEKKIKEKLNAESVSVQDTSGDGRHVCIDVVSSAFEGQSAVNRQRMVYKAIWEELQNAVHAVDQMTTKTPSEAAGGK